MGVWIWVGIVALALIAELFTNELYGVMIALSGLVSLVLTAFHLAWYISVSVFLVLGAILVFFVRKFVLKIIDQSQDANGQSE